MILDFQLRLSFTIFIEIVKKLIYEDAKHNFDISEAVRESLGHYDWTRNNVLRETPQIRQPTSPGIIRD